MCGTMGSKNQVDYVRSVLARITHLILRHTSPLSLSSYFSVFFQRTLFRPRSFVDKNERIKTNLSNISFIREILAKYL